MFASEWSLSVALRSVRPAVEGIQSSRQHSMKELRASEGGALRVLFMFDPRRQVILLLGGDKSGAVE
jgi:hypothetical protein